MGKGKKRKEVLSNRQNPLDKQILEDAYCTTSTRTKLRKRQEEEEFVNEKLSEKILKQARQQQIDLEGEQGTSSSRFSKVQTLSDFSKDDDDSDDSDDICLKNETQETFNIDEKDSRALEEFMSSDPRERATLADILKEKLTEKKTEIASEFSDAGTISDEKLEKIKPIYKGVGQVLSHYRSGKLPKAFKTLPMLSHWEEILYITEPDKWTAAAVYQGTRIFASNLKEKMAQKFYNLILLPRFRDEIEDTKMLNFHLYQAMKKALFKPGAFFKGILLPLCESGNCTLREATILGSVLAKCSIPVLHSSVAIMKIADMDYNGANSIFLRVLLEKKYSLPFRAIDAVVAHFLRFSLDKRELPLLWHQCLLTFAQLYKNDVSDEQRDALLDLLTVHRHVHVTPEIRRELTSAVGRETETMDVENM